MHGVVGAAVHEPVVVVCGHAHVSAIILRELWVMTEWRRKAGREGREGQGYCTWPNGASPHCALQVSVAVSCIHT